MHAASMNQTTFTSLTAQPETARSALSSALAWQEIW
jgi:hypothetical protein